MTQMLKVLVFGQRYSLLPRNVGLFCTEMLQCGAFQTLFNKVQVCNWHYVHKCELSVVQAKQQTVQQTATVRKTSSAVVRQGDRHDKCVVWLLKTFSLFGGQRPTWSLLGVLPVMMQFFGGQTTRRLLRCPCQNFILAATLELHLTVVFYVLTFPRGVSAQWHVLSKL